MPGGDRQNHEVGTTRCLTTGASFGIPVPPGGGRLLQRGSPPPPPLTDRRRAFSTKRMAALSIHTPGKNVGCARGALGTDLRRYVLRWARGHALWGQPGECGRGKRLAGGVAARKNYLTRNSALRQKPSGPAKEERAANAVPRSASTFFIAATRRATRIGGLGAATLRLRSLSALATQLFNNQALTAHALPRMG